jgi:hypothetical protein
MTLWHPQFNIARSRVYCFRFNSYVIEPQAAAYRGKGARECWLGFKRDDGASPAPARKPENEAAFVGADVADDVARSNVPSNEGKFDFLVAKTGFKSSDYESRAVRF